MKLLKKNLKLMAVILAMVCAVFMGTTSVSAASVTPRISQYYLAEGIGHVDYYISDSVLNYSGIISGSTLVNLINDAANSWVVTGYGYNPLYMYRTYNFNASNMDIYAGNAITSGSHTRALTTYYDVTTSGHVKIEPEYGFWDYVTINIYMNASGMTNGYNVQRAIAHEMGHAFGLADNIGNPYSVMAPFDDCYVYKPGQADHDGLNAMYG